MLSSYSVLILRFNEIIIERQAVSKSMSYSLNLLIFLCRPVQQMQLDYNNDISGMYLCQRQ